MRFSIITTLFVFIISTPILFSQTYPRWFLYPAEVKCSRSVSVITHPPTYYRDSAIAHGFRLGCDLMARYTNMQVIGGQAFWATEAGVHSMGAKYEQQYDTSLAIFYMMSKSVLDSYIDREKTLVLVGDSTCVVGEALSARMEVMRIKQPKWVEDLPIDPRHHYGVGFSEEFYYETSSWQTAEKNSYMALARSVQITMKSMQKRDEKEAQDIRDEELNVYLQNVEVVARWKDFKKKIYYVLTRMRK
ncbi:MAG: hypothetical protein ACYC09_11955 [Bacteroidota bacterium]